MTFAEWIKDRGGDSRVALMLGVSRFCVRSWRLGVRQPRPETARRLALIDPRLTVHTIYTPVTKATGTKRAA